MEALRKVVAGLGFTKVETFIASGNLIFETRAKELAAVEKRIEAALEATLGYEVATFIRSFEEVARIARYQPFSPAATAAAVSVNVGMLKGPLPAAARAAIGKLRTDIDDFHAHGSELYWLCVKGQGQSKISNAALERALKVRATFRGMRTMEKLLAKYGGD
jgi:uncharacterized protein (DUF1697 family)